MNENQHMRRRLENQLRETCTHIHMTKTLDFDDMTRHFELILGKSFREMALRNTIHDTKTQIKSLEVSSLTSLRSMFWARI